MAITLEQAKNLRPGTTLYHNTVRNSDKTPARVKVNGAPKTWKRQPERVQIPYKRGLYEYGYITENDLNDFSMTAEEALGAGQEVKK